ncbi:unnamed protein product [Owenia fusiformis]|uniref:CCHC-type domain-containing protein n=1 Tax=Owenia fusiformis TaxID=6347 RepID=A0A8S4N4D5_OWEFU|nr:unnamed protein product [Owenia fusiformis]
MATNIASESDSPTVSQLLGSQSPTQSEHGDISMTSGLTTSVNLIQETQLESEDEREGETSSVDASAIRSLRPRAIISKTPKTKGRPKKSLTTKNDVTAVLKALSTMQSSIDTTNKLMQGLQKTNADLVSQLAMKTAQCCELDKECRELRSQLSKTHSTESGLPKTLVIGSSIIRDFDTNKLHNTEVECIRGGTVDDVHKSLTDNNASYDRVILQVGSNDCSKDNTPEDIAKQYQLLIKGAKNIANEVVVSSICPRTDKPAAQEKVDTVNATLQGICSDEDASVTFINNDLSFKLQDNSINDGFLHGDGLHLSKPGTNRLAINMKLKTKGKDITKPYYNRNKNAFNKQNQQNQDNNNNNDDPNHGTNDWTTVNKKHRNNARQSPNNQTDATTHEQSKPQQGHSLRCIKCGEASHLTSSCWHPATVRCRGCNQLGHKVSRCPANRMVDQGHQDFNRF